NGQVLDSTRRGLANGGRHAHRSVCGHDDSGRARSLCAANDCAEVARICHLVEADEERDVSPGELASVRVAKGLAPRDEPLMVAGFRGLAQQSLPLDLRPRPLFEPRAMRGRSLRCPDLEDLTRPAVELADGVPPVDELA